MEQRMLVFGEALVDDFGATQRVGGAPFNVARHLAAFGMRPAMITRIGSDASGALIRAEFARCGMDLAGLQQDAGGQPTGTVTVQLDGQGGHRFTIHPDQAYDHIASAPALGVLQAACPHFIYFGTLAMRGAASRAALRAVLAASSAPRFLDLNLRGEPDESTVFDALQLADIVKVNEEELQQLFEWYAHALPCASQEEAQACLCLMENFSLQGLLVTQGECGAAYYSMDGMRTCHPGGAAPQFADSVGAGDAFSAVFLYGRVLGWPLAQTLERAHAFAAAVCAIPGAVPDTVEFYAPWLAAWGGSDAAGAVANRCG